MASGIGNLEKAGRPGVMAHALGLLLVALHAASPVEAVDLGDLLHSHSLSCAAENLTVIGNERDVTLFPGNEDGIEIRDGAEKDTELEWICGKYRQTTVCPAGTNFLWVIRRDERNFVLECRRN